LPRYPSEGGPDGVGDDPAAQRHRRSSPLTIKAITHALRATQRWFDQHSIETSKLTLLEREEYFDDLIEVRAVSAVRWHLA
jgi:hypothetical protein